MGGNDKRDDGNSTGVIKFLEKYEKELFYHQFIYFQHNIFNNGLFI